MTVVLWTALRPRFGQDPSYHAFADVRTLLGVPNAFDVLSNLAFAAVGIAALLFLARRSDAFVDRRERLPWLVLFLGVALTGVGSAWYHLAPDNARLVWDRLPMTLGFMGLLAALLAERVSVRLGLALLPVLLVAGLTSVVYWHVTEMAGRGDLRPYYLVQVYPLLAIPLLLAVFPARYTGAANLVVALAFYLAAKVAESYDAAIYGFGGLVSGHTLKHLLAAVGAWWLLRMLRHRALLPAQSMRASGRSLVG
ncbi:MAG: alkaline phytoceramidase [Candidatus Rokubacteria bacterium]|nr:alkaline phytoceramidase [Candidatus Rokubacteria bacterium]